MTEATCPDCDAAHELLDALDTGGECPVCGTPVSELHMLAIREGDE
jgi:transcription initiation factor IIE alpha subunit